MTKLPNIWQLVKLADLLVALESGKRPSGGAIGVTEGIPSLSAEHMDNQGGFKFDTLRFVPYEFYNEMPRGHIQKNDILIVKDGATTGKAAFVDDSFPFEKAVVNEHVFICRPNTHIVDPKYLFLFLWGENGQRTIGANFRGSAIGGINSSFVNEVYVPLPPLNEQRRIVAILNEKLITIDQARASAQAQLKAALALPAAYLRQVFDSPEAEKWSRVKINDISTLVKDGPHVTPTYVSKGVPFITVLNIVNRKIDFTSVRYITPEDHAKFSNQAKAEPGDILYTKDGTLGIPCVVDIDREFSFFVSVALIKLIKDYADSYYVAYALESPEVLKQVEHLGAGAGLKHMVLKSIRALEVPLPPLYKQKEISMQLKEKLAITKKVQKTIVSLLSVDDTW